MVPISFEFFPPKTPELEAKLWQSFDELSSLNPDFVSVTYGAGGTTRERTHAIVKRIAQETKISPAAHLTCVGASREEIDSVIESYRSIGVNHIVALRGDAPKGEAKYTPHPNGYSYAIDLVKKLAEIGGVEVSVSAYPEKHPESSSLKQDIEILKNKVEAGAARAITQYFFDVEHYIKFLEMARSSGINIPIVPGILPITNFAQVVKFSADCGTSIPSWMHEKFAPLEGKAEESEKLATDLAIELCQKLVENGAPALHFYTLNKAKMVREVVNSLK